MLTTAHTYDAVDQTGFMAGNFRQYSHAAAAVLAYIATTMTVFYIIYIYDHLISTVGQEAIRSSWQSVVTEDVTLMLANRGTCIVCMNVSMHVYLQINRC